MIKTMKAQKFTIEDRKSERFLLIFANTIQRPFKPWQVKARFACIAKHLQATMRKLFLCIMKLFRMPIKRCMRERYGRLDYYFNSRYKLMVLRGMNI